MLPVQRAPYRFHGTGARRRLQWGWPHLGSGPAAQAAAAATGCAASVRRPAYAISAPSIPAIEAATKHACQSTASTSDPPTLVPVAKPAIIAVTGHAYASVTAPRGATWPTSWLPAA